MRGIGASPVVVSLAVVASLVVTLSAGDAAGAEPFRDVFTAIVGTILGGPTSAVHGTDGRHHVVYEVVLTNTKNVPATLQAVEVLNRANDARLVRFDGKELLGMLRTLSARPAASLDVPPNESRVLLLSLAFTSAATVPRLLDHRIEALAADSPAATASSSISYRLAPFELAARATPIFRPPVQGKSWLVVNGCCGDTGAHRGAIHPINGRLVDSQRFAIDWLQADAEGRLVVGDPKDVRSWVSYGALVRAAAAGRVVAARNDLLDQVPGALPDPRTITVDNVDGNFVVLDHGQGIFTFYAHLQPNTVKVVRGDRVEAGQELGRLGNTGNTSAPHLHFHVMAGSSPLGSDGLPFVLSKFDLAGVIDEAALDAALTGAASLPARRSLSPATRQRQLPLDRAFIDFER
jgi:murein DD-endopeptidase MepM/ murein hydrolase activator NlpD